MVSTGGSERGRATPALIPQARGDWMEVRFPGRVEKSIVLDADPHLP
jgi:hypothetical protein